MTRGGGVEPVPKTYAHMAGYLPDLVLAGNHPLLFNDLVVLRNLVSSSSHNIISNKVEFLPRTLIKVRSGIEAPYLCTQSWLSP